MNRGTKQLLSLAIALVLLLSGGQVAFTKGGEATGVQLQQSAQVLWKAAYDWRVDHRVTPNWLELPQGQSGVATYVFDVTRLPAEHTYTAQGVVYVQNHGKKDALRRQVQVTVEYKPAGSGGWVELGRDTVSGERLIPAGDLEAWAYSVPFAPAEDAVAYRSLASVTFGDLPQGEHIFHHPLKLSLPDVPTHIEDACASISHLLSVPSGLSVDDEGVPGGQLCDSVSYAVKSKVANTSASAATCAQPVHYLGSAATVVEADTGRSVQAEASMAIRVPASASSRQLACTFVGPSTPNGQLNYLLFLPQEYGADPAQTWPLILFLHGVGERGDDLELVKRHGIPKVVEGQPAFEFIAVSPQCPKDTEWAAEIEALGALLDEVVSRYAVDTDRIYLTGLSMGGYGTWHLGAAHPERFAALAPISGGGLPEAGFPDRVCALKEVPVWAFHGQADPIVPVSESQVLVDALQACGGDAKLTVYPDAGHDVWTRTYDDSRLYQWFLEHRRH